MRNNLDMTNNDTPRALLESRLLALAATDPDCDAHAIADELHDSLAYDPLYHFASLAPDPDCIDPTYDDELAIIAAADDATLLPLLRAFSDMMLAN